MRLASILCRLAPALLALVPMLASARVGEVLFAYGSARVETASGLQSELQKGSALEEGDRVVTGSNGRLQIRMDDGGLIVLRPLSELVIEQFQYPAASGAASAAVQTPYSLMSLVRGGFRAITGALGKANPDAVEMHTPVATIGIRGTDYSALYCAADCGDLGLDPGLYVGVTEGAIVVANAAGHLDLGKGEYGFVADDHSAPVTAPQACAALAQANQATRSVGTEIPKDPSRGVDDAIAANTVAIATPATPEVAVVAEDGGGDDVDLTTGSLGGVPTAYAGALGAGFSGVSAAGASGAVTDSSGSITAFSGVIPDGNAHLEHRGGVTLDAGRDVDRADATGLRWGRWSGGSVATTTAGATESHALTDESLHWIASSGGPQPELPRTGTASFELIGNTNPTDDHGRVGTLGSASLAADFTARTVDADLSLSFVQTSEVWNASAQNLAINVPQATFGGAFDSVAIRGPDSTRSGFGSLSGFFTGNARGTLLGAGVSYGLSDGATNVAGTAAFQRVQPGH